MFQKPRQFLAAAFVFSGLNHRAQGIRRDFHTDICPVVSVIAVFHEVAKTWSTLLEAVSAGDYLFITH